MAISADIKPKYRPIAEKTIENKDPIKASKIFSDRSAHQPQKYNSQQATSAGGDIFNIGASVAQTGVRSTPKGVRPMGVPVPQSNPMPQQNPIEMLLQMLLEILTSLFSPKQEPAGPKNNEAFTKGLEDTGRADFTVDGQKYAIVKSDSDSGYSAKIVNDDGSLGKTIDKSVQGPDSDLGVKGFFEVGGIKGMSGANRAYIGNSDPSGEVKVMEAEAGLDKGHKYRDSHSDMVMKSGKELNGGAAELPDASKAATYALDNWTAFETAIQGNRNAADDFLGKNDLQTIIKGSKFSADDKAAAKDLLILANTTGKNGFTKDEVARASSGT